MRAFLLLCFVSSLFAHFAQGNESSASLTATAWSRLKSDPGAAAKTARQCIERYRKQALEQQKTPGEPQANWALNDVGTCYWILGQALEKQEKLQEATVAYRVLAEEFDRAQCWDSKGWFWGLEKAARERLGTLKVLLDKSGLEALEGIEWELVWSDEFEKDGPPDPAKWTAETGFVRNWEAQYYTNRLENARVEDGHLILEARKDALPLTKKDPLIRGNNVATYTSACLTTEQSKPFTYGRVDVRAKLPTGRGTWPAIWTLGSNIHKVGWPKCGEIDIMEHVGFDQDVVHAYVHTEGFHHLKSNSRGNHLTKKGVSDDFHVYSLIWTEKVVRVCVDNDCHFTFINDGTGVDSWPFDEPQYLLLNLAIGGTWGGRKGIDDTIFPQQFLIDYVRLYEEKK